VARRSGSLQSSDILLFESNRRRNQTRHTLTIRELMPKRNPFAGTPGPRQDEKRHDRGDVHERYPSPASAPTH
jgi:hypothetical protein